MEFHDCSTDKHRLFEQEEISRLRETRKFLRKLQRRMQETRKMLSVIQARKGGGTTTSNEITLEKKLTDVNRVFSSTSKVWELLVNLRYVI